MPGMEPQQVIWSPQPLPGGKSFSIAVLYQGNIWMVDVDSGQARQLTGEGVVSKIAWK
jgi:streptogramin lyase